MMSWSEFRFPPVNLYSVSRFMDVEEIDLEYLYASLAKRGLKPSGEDEERFIEEVEGLSSPDLSRMGARRQALEKLYGKA